MRGQHIRKSCICKCQIGVADVWVFKGLLLVDKALKDLGLGLIELSFYDCPGKSVQGTLNVDDSTGPAVEEVEMLVRHTCD